MPGAHHTSRRRRVGAGGLLIGLLVTAVGVLAPAAGAQEPGADLSVSVTHQPSAPKSGIPFSFEVTATNDGPATATEVLAGLSFQYPLLRAETGDGCEGSPTGSAICTLGDLAPGTSATVTVTVIAQASGVYQVPVVVSSPTADPDLADRATTDTVLVTPGPSRGERYMADTFPLILRRAPGEAALAYWADRFDTAGRTCCNRLVGVPFALIASAEHRRVRVADAYAQVLGRAPDASALAYWSAQLGAGTSDARLVRLLVASAEFRTAHAGDLVAAVYRVVLGRGPTGPEASTWAAALARGVRPDEEAALLQASLEGLDVVIDGYFQLTLGHLPNQLGRYVWRAGLRQGTSPQRLWAELLVGGEYLRRYPPTADDDGVPQPVPVFEF